MVDFTPPQHPPSISQAFAADPMAPYRAAIANNESGGNYATLGPVTKRGDRALGKYGIMRSNLQAWGRETIGREVTPEEFLASPDIQDKIFNRQFGGLLKANSPQDAASIWLTGRTLANGGAGARDQLGTSGAAYADKFMAGLGKMPNFTGAAPAMAAGSPKLPSASSGSPPATSAPDFSAIAAPSPQAVNWAQILAGLAPPSEQAKPPEQVAPRLARLAPQIGANLTQNTAGNLLLTS